MQAFLGSSLREDVNRKQLDVTDHLDLCARLTWERLLSVYAHLLDLGVFLSVESGGVEQVELSLMSPPPNLRRLTAHMSSFIFISPILSLHCLASHTTIG